MNFDGVLELFLCTESFIRGVILATRAGFAGESVSVELCPTDRCLWRLLRPSEIGSKYKSPGIMLTMPTLDDAMYAEAERVASFFSGQYLDAPYLEHMVHFLAGSSAIEECQQALRDRYADAVLLRETEENKECV